MNADVLLPCSSGSDFGAVGALGGKWKLQITYHLMGGVMRFGELHRAIPGVTQHMSTASLREMEADGIVVRTVYPQVPPKVEYCLSETGRDVKPEVDALVTWGRRLPSRTRVKPVGDSA